MYRVLILAFCCSLSFSSISQWYEVEGQAYISNGDKKAARTLAMENALKKALLVAGASVSSVQQVVNGLVTQDELSIRASGTVNSIDIIDETYNGDYVSVTIRADIFPQQKQCFAADYKKSIVITQTKILHREQANVGEIYKLDMVVPELLNNKIAKHSRFIDAHLVAKNKTNFSRLNSSFQNEEIKEMTMELGHMFDSQYVLYSEINDLSFGTNKLNHWKVWQEAQFERYFTTTLYLYSSVNGEFIFSKEYHSQAPWKYGKRARVDLNSNEFWQSQYGNMLDRTIESAIIDIDESVMCEQTRAKILEVNGTQVMINLGKQHGVQVGDEFSLLHVNTFKSNIGKTYPNFNVSPFKVKVTVVHQANAIAEASDDRLFSNIQINDLAIKDN